MDTASQTGVLQGVLTERDLPAAEEEFPGITSFFARSVDKPRTFLELVFAFEARRATSL